MKLAVWLFYFSLGISSLSFGIGFISSGSPGFSVSAFVLGGFWALAHRRAWTWADRLSFATFCLIMAAGAWQGVGELWLSIGIAAALISWDSSHLITRANQVDRIDHQEGVIRRHLLRLGWVLIIGLGLCLLALNLHLAYTFGWALILALVMILALSRVISFLRES